METGRPVHVPVLYQPVLFWLQPSAGKRILDGTLGAGGHAEAILAAGAMLLGLDRDAEALETARKRLAPFGGRALLRQASYRRAGEILHEIGWPALDGALLDLGLSSLQLEEAERGFAFQREGPLDMRFDRSQGETAADLVNTLPEEELARILSVYGEERDAMRIAIAIGRARPIGTTRQLAEVVAGAAHRKDRAPGSIHPATRTFQALRIAVNRELEELEAALPILVDCLAPGGRLAVISFHSLEDRIVKQAFRRAAGRTADTRPAGLRDGSVPQAILRDLTRKPIEPDEEERGMNPRARSAKLRVVEKLPRPEPMEIRARKSGRPMTQ